MIRLTLGIKNKTDAAKLRASASEWLVSAAGRRNMGLCHALVEMFDADPTEKLGDKAPSAVERSGRGGFGGELLAFWERRQIEQAQELGRSAEQARRRREGSSPPRI